MQENVSNIDARHRTLITLWFALLTNIAFFFALTFFIERHEPVSPPSRLLTLVFVALGCVLVILSFAVKQKVLSTATARQDVSLVQKGLIIACAMCEVSAILGLVAFMVVGNRDYIILFVLAAVGIALHFPKRDQLLAATYKGSLNRVVH